MGYEAQMACSASSRPLFWRAILTSKVGQTGLVFKQCYLTLMLTLLAV